MGLQMTALVRHRAREWPL